MRLTSSRSRISNSLVGVRQLSPAWASALVIAALAVTFEIDRLTSAAPVQHLYYVPIIVAAVRFGRRGGLSTAFGAVLLYHMANPPLWTFQYEQLDLLQIVLFVAVAWVAAKLTHDARRLQKLAMTDDLTGLHNLRSFEPRLAAMVRASRDTHAPLALLVVDVDRLKSLNDCYGHLAGAEAVRTVGHVIGSCLPPGSVACRYGGDEFVIAIPRCEASQAKARADDLRRAVNSTAAVLAGMPFPAGTLNISVGLACYPSLDDGVAMDEPGAGDVESCRALFRAADAALYIAKESGRNQVHMT